MTEETQREKGGAAARLAAPLLTAAILVVVTVIWAPYYLREPEIVGKLAQAPEETTSAVTREVVISKVISGDTFETAGGEHIRLAGVAAARGEYVTGWAARTFAQRRIASGAKPVLRTCDKEGIHSTGAILGRLYPDGLTMPDLGTQLLKAGWAAPDKFTGELCAKRFIARYNRAAFEARADEKGIWRSGAGRGFPAHVAADLLGSPDQRRAVHIFSGNLQSAAVKELDGGYEYQAILTDNFNKPRIKLTALTKEHPNEYDSLSAADSGELTVAGVAAGPVDRERPVELTLELDFELPAPANTEQ